MLRSASWCRFLDAKSDKISMAAPLRNRKYAFTVVYHVKSNLQEKRKQGLSDTQHCIQDLVK